MRGPSGGGKASAFGGLDRICDVVAGRLQPAILPICSLEWPLLAQLDRASGFEPDGWGIEPSERTSQFLVRVIR